MPYTKRILAERELLLYHVDINDSTRTYITVIWEFSKPGIWSALNGATLIGTALGETHT
jgi:hypothetical protein